MYWLQFAADESIVKAATHPDYSFCICPRFDWHLSISKVKEERRVLRAKEGTLTPYRFRLLPLSKKAWNRPLFWLRIWKSLRDDARQ